MTATPRRTAYRCAYMGCTRPNVRLGRICRRHALQWLRAAAHPRTRTVALLAWSRAGRRQRVVPVTVQAGLFDAPGWVA